MKTVKWFGRELKTLLQPNPLRVLVACEFSGVVRDAFAARGHDAVSCDIVQSISFGRHIQRDVLEILDMGWDLMIAHPPCTYLTNAAATWNKLRPERAAKTQEAKDFAQMLWEAPIPKICIENPLGSLGSVIGKHTQMIQPYEFGDNFSKRTCLWLKGVRPLRWNGRRGEPLKSVNDAMAGPNRAKDRSRFFPMVAKAMAEQWG